MELNLFFCEFSTRGRGIYCRNNTWTQDHNLKNSKKYIYELFIYLSHKFLKILPLCLVFSQTNLQWEFHRTIEIISKDVSI